MMLMRFATDGGGVYVCADEMLQVLLGTLCDT